MSRRVLSEEELVKDRLAYLGSLASGLAHEVRTPLNSIHLNVELLERASYQLKGEAEADFQRRVKRIKEAVASLQKTLNEFLHFARPPSIKRLATDLQDFIHDLAEFLEPELTESSVKLRLQIAEHPYPVLIDRSQMAQVLQNIVLNARDAMPDGGTITITTREERDMVSIEILDEGKGIDPAVGERIFEAFFTTKKEGTGLGLSIARRIVAEHYGRLEFKSPGRPGVPGTLFSILLPKEKLLCRPGVAVADAAADDETEARP